MNPDDFDDDVVVTQTGGKLSAEHKLTIRKMIREAIRWQNQQVLFTCRECCFYIPPDEKIINCRLDPNNQVILAKRMPTQMPECFIFDPLESAFANVLTLMHSLDIDFHGAKHGWATIVGRIAQRADKFGYISGVTQRNLNRYES